MKKLACIILGLVFISSCAVPVIPAEQASGNYTGQYTYNSTISYNVLAVVTKVSDNSVTTSFSGSGISPLTITGISVTANSNNTSFALTKTGMTESLSGAVENNQLSVSYSFMSGAMTYVGNK